MSAMVCNRGKPSTTAIMEQLNAEMEESIRKGTSTFPVEQEYRVSWDGIACWPYLSHNLRTLKKYGINMVASSYGKAWAIEYEDLDGMAWPTASPPPTETMPPPCSPAVWRPCSALTVTEPFIM